MSTTTLPPTAPEAAPGPGPAEAPYALVDCDVHPLMPEGMASLRPFLSAAGQRRLGLDDRRALTTATYREPVSIPRNTLFTNQAGVLRGDAASPEGAAPGADPAPHGPAAARRLRHRPRRADRWRGAGAGRAPRPRQRGADRRRLQRLAGGDLAGVRPALPRDDHRRGARPAAGRGRDPPLRRRRAVRGRPAADDRRAARRAALLPDLRGGRRGRPPGHAAPQLRRGHLPHLPVVGGRQPHLLRRVAHGAQPGLRGQRREPGLPRGLRTLPRPEGRRHRGRDRLGARRHVAPRQERPRAARRGALAPAAPERVPRRPRPLHDPAAAGAGPAVAPAHAVRDRARRADADVQLRLPALGLRRPAARADLAAARRAGPGPRARTRWRRTARGSDDASRPALRRRRPW